LHARLATESLHLVWCAIRVLVRANMLYIRF